MDIYSPLPFRIYLLSIFNPPRMFFFFFFVDVFGHPHRWLNKHSNNNSKNKVDRWSPYLSVVDIVVRWKRRGGEIAWNDDRLARVEHVMTGLNIGPSDNIVLGTLASASVASASSRWVVRKVNVARLRHKNALHIKWRQPLHTPRIYSHTQTRSTNE